jgi:hypothetical protein
MNNESTFRSREDRLNRPLATTRFDGTRGEWPAAGSPNPPSSRPRGDMLHSLFSAFAVGLTLTLAVATVVIPFLLGFFDRPDIS